MTMLFTGVNGSAPADTVLFCFPPAGAGPSTFADWRRQAHAVELRVLTLPGRESRLVEPPGIDLDAITDAVVEEAAGRPFALYGHSLGAVLAYETTRLLRARGQRLPVRLFLGACRPPDQRDPLVEVALLPDDEFLAAVTELGGIPEGLLDVPGMREVVLPALRHDFQWLHDYRYQPGEPLDVPLVTVLGEADRTVPAQAMALWEEHTTAGVRQRRVDGDHFFHQSHAQEVLETIETELGAQPTGLVPLGDTQWQVWDWGLLRSAGFPATGLNLFAAPGCAAAADELLAGTADRARFDEAFAATVAEQGVRLAALADDPLFREAVTWQNPGVLIALDRLAHGDPAKRGNVKHRAAEKIVARYWSRYCGKNDTIGFFGPVCWVRLGADPGQESTAAADVRPGPGLVSHRVVHLEWWALDAFAASRGEQVREHLSVRLQPHLHVADGVLLRPAQAPLALRPEELAVLTRCDGRSAAALAQDAAADPSAGLRKPSDALLVLGRLAEQDIVRWRLDLPVDITAEQHLRDWADSVADGPVREALRRDLGRLLDGRDAVAAAAGDPAALRTALTELDATFTELTGLEPHQGAGQAYAGRGLVVEDTLRDLEVRLGPAVLDRIAAPLDLLLRAARWLTEEVARVHVEALTELFHEHAQGRDHIPLAEIWWQFLALIFTEATRPVGPVVEDFRARWADLLGLADRPDGPGVQLDSADLLDRVDEVFPPQGPGWPGARIHSPDVVLCAPDPEAVRRGEVTAVLGEIHAAWLTNSSGCQVQFHPDVDALRAAVRRDLGPRVVPLYPLEFQDFTARLADLLLQPGDRRLGYTAAPSRDDVLPASALTLSRDPAEGLTVSTTDGRRWPIVEVIGEFMAFFTADAFKLVGTGEHSPRVTIDHLVLFRETWRTTVDRTGLAGPTKHPDRYLAARTLVDRLGLPDRVFVKIGTETKPFFTDLTSPVSVAGLATMLRGVHEAHGPDVSVTFTEQLPTPDQAWVPDAEGQHYLSELRIQVRDPRQSSRRNR